MLLRSVGEGYCREVFGKRRVLSVGVFVGDVLDVCDIECFCRMHKVLDRDEL